MRDNASLSANATSLMERLENNASDMGNPLLERRLADLAIWYFQNRNRIGRDDIPRRQDFLEKAFWVQMEVIALMAERIQELEGKKMGSELWLPKGVRINGDLRKNG